MSIHRPSASWTARRVRPAPITQRELATYYRKRARLKALAQSVLTLRDSLLARHQAGAEIDRGPYVLRARDVESQRPTWAELTRILGERHVARLRAKIPI